MKEISSYSKSTTPSVIFKPCSCSHDLSDRYILGNLRATTYQMAVFFVTILFFLGLPTVAELIRYIDKAFDNAKQIESYIELLHTFC